MEAEFPESSVGCAVPAVPGSECLEITSTLISFLTKHCNELINVSLLQVWNLYPVSSGNKN